MNDGLVTTKSANDFSTTVSRLAAAIMARSMTLFAIVDHADGAELAGLELGPTTLLIFGDAKGGTPLMQENQRTGIDLPLKVLVWRDSAGVWLTANDPIWIAQRHGLNTRLAESLAAALKAVMDEAAR
jgi:uncharacterized protein (DUF302 family)